MPFSLAAAACSCRCIYTDDHLRVKGSDGTMYACGDAATIHYPNALELANALFDKADEDNVGAGNTCRGGMP